MWEKIYQDTRKDMRDPGRIAWTGHYYNVLKDIVLSACSMLRTMTAEYPQHVVNQKLWAFAQPSRVNANHTQLLNWLAGRSGISNQREPVAIINTSQCLNLWASVKQRFVIFDVAVVTQRFDRRRVCQRGFGCTTARYDMVLCASFQHSKRQNMGQRCGSACSRQHWIL